eukprot:s395_g15.t1
METKSVEDRLTALEERTDEWNSTLRVRIVGATALAKRGSELADGTREFWKLKTETVELLLIDMPNLFPDPTQRNTIRLELKESLSHLEFVFGVFPIAGRWGSEKSIDLKMRAGLPAMRSHALVKTILGTKLKQFGGQFQLWIPFSQTDMKRKTVSAKSARNVRPRPNDEEDGKDQWLDGENWCCYIELCLGINWHTFVDGRLTRRRSGFQATSNRKEHIFGDLEFADDTATIATEAEFSLADQFLEKTFTDWGEKFNRSKTEALTLTPNTPPEPRRAPPQQYTSVRHVGGILSDTGSQWKDTLHRCTQARQRAKQIAKAWSTGTHRGRGQTSRVKLLARLRVMKSIIIPTLTTFGRTRSWSKAQINVQNYALQRVFGLDRLAMH